jgi:hypothetical protein
MRLHDFLNSQIEINILLRFYHIYLTSNVTMGCFIYIIKKKNVVLQ